MAAGIYLYARLVSPRIPESGEIDLQRVVTVVAKCRAWPRRRHLAVAGAEYRSEPDWRIGARDSNWGLDLVLFRTADGVIGMMVRGASHTGIVGRNVSLCRHKIVTLLSH